MKKLLDNFFLYWFFQIFLILRVTLTSFLPSSLFFFQNTRIIFKDILLHKCICHKNNYLWNCQKFFKCSGIVSSFTKQVFQQYPISVFNQIWIDFRTYWKFFCERTYFQKSNKSGKLPTQKNCMTMFQLMLSKSRHSNFRFFVE